MKTNDGRVIELDEVEQVLDTILALEHIISILMPLGIKLPVGQRLLLSRRLDGLETVKPCVEMLRRKVKAHYESK